MDNCTGRPDEEGNGVVAALNCQAVDSGPGQRPLVVEFSDLNAAESWFTNNTSGFDDRDDCADGYKLGPWQQNGTTVGALGCAYTGTNQFRMVWTINSALIGVIAEGSYGPTMYSWWSNNANVVS